MRARWTRLILFGMGAAGAFLIASGVLFAQCAMCRTALLNSPEGQKLASAFRSGILFLLSAPFAVVGTIGFLIFKGRPGNRGIPETRAGLTQASTATRV